MHARGSISVRLGAIHLQQAAGWVMLAAAALIGFWSIRWGIGDVEANALVAGVRMNAGDILYRDIFSHHFPFYYFWSAAVIKIFGQSIFWARASVWLYQLAVLAAMMKLSRLYLSIGATGLLWSILRHLYENNLFVYRAFSSISVLGLVILVIVLLIEKEEFRLPHAIAMALLSAVSVLADPLTIYPVAFSIVVILIKSPKRGLQVTAIAGALAACFFGYLLATGTLQVFLSDAIRFNSDIYAKYNGNFSSALRFYQVRVQITSGLDLLNPAWFNMDPHRVITTEPTDFDRWFFTGFLYRTSCLLTAALFMLHKKPWAAAYVFLVAAAALAIYPWGAYGVTFVLVAVFFTALFLSQEIWSKKNGRFLGGAKITVRVILALMVAWLGYRTVSYTSRNLEERSYLSYFSDKLGDFAKLEALACGLPDVSLGYYPGNIYPYFFTDLKAVSRYYFMWPWVAEIALPEILDALGQDGAMAIVNRTNNGLVFGQFDTRDYLKPLDEYLRDNYLEVRRGIFVSPALAEACHHLPIR